jgi:mRNA-degrading endonuclease RelE of RelBE toxin-antitoxin system
MENEIYIVNGLADTLDRLPDDKREKVASMIDSLAGEGWKNSQIVAPDDSQGGGLRAFHSGDLRLLFRYAPEQHAIIVTSVAAMYEQELAAAV